MSMQVTVEDPVRVNRPVRERRSGLKRNRDTSVGRSEVAKKKKKVVFTDQTSKFTAGRRRGRPSTRAPSPVKSKDLGKSSSFTWNFREYLADDELAPTTLRAPVDPANPFGTFRIARAASPGEDPNPNDRGVTRNGEDEDHDSNKENIPPYLPLYAPRPHRPAVPVLVINEGQAANISGRVVNSAEPLGGNSGSGYRPEYRSVAAQAFVNHAVDGDDTTSSTSNTNAQPSSIPNIFTEPLDLGPVPVFEFSSFDDIQKAIVDSIDFTDPRYSSAQLSTDYRPYSINTVLPPAPQFIVTADDTANLYHLPTPLPAVPEFGPALKANLHFNSHSAGRAPTPDLSQPFTYNPADGAILLPGTIMVAPNPVFDDAQPSCHFDAAMQGAAYLNHSNMNTGYLVGYDRIAMCCAQCKQVNHITPQDVLNGGMGELRERGRNGQRVDYTPHTPFVVVPPSQSSTSNNDNLVRADGDINRNDRASSAPIRTSPSPFEEDVERERELQKARTRERAEDNPRAAGELIWTELILDVRRDAYRRHQRLVGKGRNYRKLIDLCVSEKKARDRSRGRYVESAKEENGSFQLMSTYGADGGVEGIIMRNMQNMGIRREGVWSDEHQKFRVGAGEHWKTVDEWKEVLRSGGLGLDNKVRKDLGIDKIQAGELTEDQIKNMLADRIDIIDAARAAVVGAHLDLPPGYEEEQDTDYYTNSLTGSFDSANMDVDTSNTSNTSPDGEDVEMCNSLLAELREGGYMDMTFD